MRRLKILFYSQQNIVSGSDVITMFSSFIEMISAVGKIELHILTDYTDAENARIEESIKGLPAEVISPPFLKGNSEEQNTDIMGSGVTAFINSIDEYNKYDLILLNGKDSIVSSLSTSYVHKVIPYLSADEKWFKRFKYQRLLKELSNRFPHILTETELVKERCQRVTTGINTDYLVAASSVRQNAKEAAQDHSYTMIYHLPNNNGDEMEKAMETFHHVRDYEKAVTLRIINKPYHIKPEIAEKASHTPGVIWEMYGDENRQLKILSQADIGYVHKKPDEEVIRHFLIYASAGKPVVLPRTKRTQKLLGVNYPLFAKTPKEAALKMRMAFNDRRVFQATAKICFNAFLRYKDEDGVSRMKRILWKYNKKNPTILFAGHDFKFLKPYMVACKEKGLHVLIDKWQGHERHDPFVSHVLLQQADIIFCEWGLGNAEFYAAHKHDDQKLYIRVHRQELETTYLERIDFDRVTNVIAVSAHTLESFIQFKQVPRSKMKFIPNMMDVQKFKQPKTESSMHHIGIVGIIPQLKRLDRAVEILDILWERDSRFKLFIKGRLPGEISWMKNRKSEMAYYKEIFARIEEAPWKDNVIFSGFGDDMEEWFKDIGFILSTSDIESFHLAPMEGVASGAQPIIFNWEGSDVIYPPEWIVKNEDEAVELIKYYAKRGINVEKYMSIPKKYDKENVVRQLDQLIFG